MHPYRGSEQTEDIESGDGDPTPGERQPLLNPKADWTPPRGFIWIQISLFANVFLSGFDSTVTASTYAVISSDFNAANTASWLTTSYLLTQTAFQPLYGRFSDILGRRLCFFVSTVTFMIGCLGCGLAGNIIILDVMRAITGLGGGGLITMATIINSDMIPFERRGMYQAAQNALFGFGLICGASFGGMLADSIGWRWCFLLQVPISFAALVVGYFVIMNPDEVRFSVRVLWQRIDFSGAFVLVVALCLHLLGLSLGGNELPWSSVWVILSLVGSVILFAVFIVVESKTSAAPVVPLHMLKGALPVATQVANLFAGMSAYGFLFTLPLFFQAVLLDSPSKAGARLAIPSLATPIGGILAGYIMTRWGRLALLVRIGAGIMLLGTLLVVSLRLHDSTWKYYVYVFPANLGQGIIYPSILFTFLSAFDHKEQATSTSTVYLIRSVGWVWGVAIVSAIIQGALRSKLPGALGDIEDKELIIEKIRHSVSTLRLLPLEIQKTAQSVYYYGLRWCFGASAVFAFISTLAAFFTKGKGLQRKA